MFMSFFIASLPSIIFLTAASTPEKSSSGSSPSFWIVSWTFVRSNSGSCMFSFIACLSSISFLAASWIREPSNCGSPSHVFLHRLFVLDQLLGRLLDPRAIELRESLADRRDRILDPRAIELRELDPGRIREVKLARLDE